MNPDSLGGLLWRVEKLEREAELLDERKASVHDVEKAVAGLTKDVDGLRDELRGMRVLGFTIVGSVVSGSVLFALTMLALFGHG